LTYAQQTVSADELTAQKILTLMNSISGKGSPGVRELRKVALVLVVSTRLYLSNKSLSG